MYICNKNTVYSDTAVFYGALLNLWFRTRSRFKICFIEDCSIHIIIHLLFSCKFNLKRKSWGAINEGADARASFNYFIYCKVVICTNESEKLRSKVEIGSKSGLERICARGCIFVLRSLKQESIDQVTAPCVSYFYSLL